MPEKTERELAREEKLRIAAQIRLKEDYRRTFLATPHGKRVLKDIFELCQVFDYHSDVRREGMRDVGLTILNALDKRSFQGLIDLQDQDLGLTELEKE